MTLLNNRNNDTSQAIATVNEQLAQMQQMIVNLQSEMRTLNQQHKAQETLTKEWNNTVKTVKKQLKDSCSVYGTPEALDDMSQDILNIVEEVKNEFDAHVQSDRFLNQETAEIEDEMVNNVIPLISANEELPSPDDNETVLNPKQIEKILEPLSEDTLKQLKSMFNISGKVIKLSSIAYPIAKHNVTHSKLSRLITNIESQQLLLAGV